MWSKVYNNNGVYDFDYALQRLAMDPLTHMDQTQRWVDVPVRLGDEQHVVRVKGIGTTDNPAFEISSNSKEQQDVLLKHISHLFQWDVDLMEVKRHFKETNLNQLFDMYPGTPIIKDFDLYGSLMKVIIHQQLNLKFAHTLTSRFVQHYGECVNGVWFDPTPETIASLPYEALRNYQFSQRKAEYVIDTSRMIVDGELELDTLAKENDQVILSQLVKIRGIGKWTAENWLLFALGRKDLFPRADIGIQNALKRYFQMDRKPTIDEMNVLSSDWSPYQSYASITLWRSIE
ncbi:DNA-3-methyladenine glycosylase [Aquibacillus sp. 3ASR75-11]|uniref:DNA-3-methyladenine glycosylase II n=1 Tax=Terrihalobacillus insolitus TaxID=2950438 RepID=A0A9X3WSZ0_9BACI|nr:DNA-3-methyladenine glycosylase [Terrihalobacillus insolitus]MDC3413457.1 DNA-3-methyladenine glycosylase [Terrihalobacillus insolitus]MDC3425252.1 DNA-3-methyladenine glycosylase [Terrihalobacillus insolitus]